MGVNVSQRVMTPFSVNALAKSTGNSCTRPPESFELTTKTIYQELGLQPGEQSLAMHLLAAHRQICAKHWKSVFDRGFLRKGLAFG